MRDFAVNSDKYPDTGTGFRVLGVPAHGENYDVGSMLLVRGSLLPGYRPIVIIVAKQCPDGRRADDAAVDRAAAPPLGS